LTIPEPALHTALVKPTQHKHFSGPTYTPSTLLRVLHTTSPSTHCYVAEKPGDNSVVKAMVKINEHVIKN